MRHSVSVAANTAHNNPSFEIEAQTNCVGFFTCKLSPVEDRIFDLEMSVSGIQGSKFTHNQSVVEKGKFVTVGITEGDHVVYKFSLNRLTRVSAVTQLSGGQCVTLVKVFNRNQGLVFEALYRDGKPVVRLNKQNFAIPAQGEEISWRKQTK